MSLAPAKVILITTTQTRGDTTKDSEIVKQSVTEGQITLIKISHVINLGTLSHLIRSHVRTSKKGMISKQGKDQKEKTPQHKGTENFVQICAEPC
jgi:hypothetical protein